LSGVEADDHYMYSGPEVGVATMVSGSCIVSDVDGGGKESFPQCLGIVGRTSYRGLLHLCSGDEEF